MGPVAGRAEALSTARGFTLIELLVVVSVVAVLFGVALDRLLRYQELAERTAMEQNVAAINTALNMKFAALVASGRGAKIEEELHANPVDLLARPPQDYQGEHFDPAPGSFPKRSWYFDRKSGELVYLPGRTRYLAEPASAATAGIHFRVLLTELSGRRDSGVHELRQPYLAATEAYRWIIQ